MTWHDDDSREIEARRHAAQLSTRTHPAAPGRAASVTTARTIGTLALVDVGWQVWSHDDALRGLLDARSEPRGGVVVEITNRRNADPDTGELTAVRAFRCLDPYTTRRPENPGRGERHRLRWVTLTETQINPNAVALPQRQLTWRVIATLCLEAARPGARLDLVRTETDRLAALADAARLARTLTA